MLGDLDAAYIVGPRARYKKEKSAATFRFQFVFCFFCARSVARLLNYTCSPGSVRVAFTVQL